MLIILAVLLIFQQCNAICYFSKELQGEFKMQRFPDVDPDKSFRYNENIDGDIEYSTVNITDYAIPIWGLCHKRIGNNVILTINSGNESCIRCIHIKLRSRYIVHVYGIGQKDINKCYTDEKSAIENCPIEETMDKSNKSRPGIILFRKRNFDEQTIQPEYCPFHGSYTFQYRYNGFNNKLGCSDKNRSVINFCPSGGDLNVQFSYCSFADKNITYKCLGHWEGSDNKHYLALADKERDVYRCAMYHKYENGTVVLGINHDARCVYDTKTFTPKYELFIMKPIPQLNWPEVKGSACKYPAWLIGNWQYLTVDEDTIIYKDHKSFKTYTIKCLGISKDKSQDETDVKYFIFSRSQCQEESYSCLWLKRRSVNVIEFQIGTQSSENKSFDLCDGSNFFNDTWITQAKLKTEQQSPCPVTGDYTGNVPDAKNICAKLSSDCDSQEKMNYEVSDCKGNEIYEKRQYRCLGQWEENGLLYTYTQRHDLAAGMYECFVGSILSHSLIHIMEAGQNCQRNVDPLTYGMKLYKQASCLTSNKIPVLQPHNNSVNYSKDGWTSPAPPSIEFKNTSAATNLQTISPIGFLIIFLFRILLHKHLQ